MFTSFNKYLHNFNQKFKILFTFKMINNNVFFKINIKPVYSKRKKF